VFRTIDLCRRIDHCGSLRLPEPAVAIGEAALDCRSRVAGGLPHLIEDLAAAALEAGTAVGSAGPETTRSISGVVFRQAGSAETLNCAAINRRLIPVAIARSRFGLCGC
jgi:hypothetical protein